MRRFLSFALVLVLFLALAASSFAADMDYEGYLDIISGDPDQGMTGEKKQNDTAKPPVGDGSVYDAQNKLYLYTFAQNTVAVNFPSGIVTTYPVSITVPDGLGVEVYRDGNAVTDETPDSLTKPGAYAVFFGGDSRDSLTFTIVGSVTGALQGYRIPTGFYVAEASRDGEAIEASAYVDMTLEGKYEIVIRSKNVNSAHSLSVTVDHTAPTLKLEAVENGFAKGPVDISDAEDEYGNSVSITLDGTKQSYTKTLTKSGDYKVAISDRAGNRTVYSFTIGIYFNFSAVLFIIFIILFILGLMLYLARKRKKLRIR